MVREQGVMVQWWVALKKLCREPWVRILWLGEKICISLGFVLGSIVSFGFRTRVKSSKNMLILEFAIIII